MIGMDVLLDVIATEAIEGGSRDHFFDETRNRDYIPPGPESAKRPGTEQLPPIAYTLELVKRPDGSYEWVE